MQKNKSLAHNIKNSQGFTLIETLVGAAILGMVLLGPVSFLTTSFTKVGTSQDRLTALYLAEEGIELTRRMRDNNILDPNLDPLTRPWNFGLGNGNYEIDYNSPLTAYVGTFLRYNSANGLYSYDSGNATRFTRRITLSNIATDQLRITSHIDWSDRFGSVRSAELQEVMYNWQ